MVTTLTTRNTKSSNKNNNYSKCLLGGNFQLLQEFDFSFVSWRKIIIIVLSVATGDLLTSYHINSDIPSLTVTQIMLNNCLGPCRKLLLSDSSHLVVWNKIYSLDAALLQSHDALGLFSIRYIERITRFTTIMCWETAYVNLREWRSLSSDFPFNNN